VKKLLTGSEGYVYIYAVEVKNKSDFNHLRVKQKLTMMEYTKYGRGSQMKLVNKTYKLIENTLKKNVCFFI
jgi:hypothetical protein